MVLEKCIQSIPGYIKRDEENIKTCRIAADKQLTIYLYLVNVDHEKDGSVLTGLNSKRLLDNDQFP